MSVLLLCAHGSRDPEWRVPFESLAADAGPSARLCYLDLAEPSIEDALEDALTGGASEVRLLPLFLAAGKHVRADIGGIVERARTAHPTAQIELLPPVGEDARLRSALSAIVSESAR